MTNITGTEFNDTIRPAFSTIGQFTTDANDVVLGLDGNDELQGSLGNDTLFGGNDNDLLGGGPGDDSLLGELGDDTLAGGDGADAMNGGNGFNWADYWGLSPLIGATIYLAVNPGNVNGGAAAGDSYSFIQGVAGTDFADLIGASFAASWLKGNGGNDTLISGNGADTLDGGDGSDWASYNGIYYSYTPGSAGLFVSLVMPWLNTGQAAGDSYNSIENLAGTAGNDTLVGSNAANVIIGLDGDDLLEGGSGADTLDGGTGTNTVSYFDGGAASIDLLNRAATDGFGFVDSIENFQNANGSTSGDFIQGSNVANLLRGLGGGDRVFGLIGDDTLFGGTGADSLDGGEGNDVLTDHTQEADASGQLTAGTYAPTDADTLLGGAGVDLIMSSGGGDVIDGGADIDNLLMDFTPQAGALVFTMAAGATPWTMTLGGVLTATVSNVETLLISGSAGRDSMNAAKASFYVVLDGGAGNDVVRGGASGDVLVGSAGNDKLFGNGGDDLLVGGAGRDTLVGGAGADLFRWDVAAEGRDVIQGFQTGFDRLWVDASGFRGGLVENIDLAATGRFVLGTAATAAKGQFIYDQATGTLNWDVDGTGAKLAVLLATLDPGTTLAAGDFLVVA